MLGCLLRNPEKSVDKFLKSRLEKSVDLRSLLTEVCWLEKSVDRSLLTFWNKIQVNNQQTWEDLRSLLTWKVCWLEKSVDLKSQQTWEVNRLEKSVDLRSLLTWEVNRLEESTDLRSQQTSTWEVCWLEKSVDKFQVNNQQTWEVCWQVSQKPKLINRLLKRQPRGCFAWLIQYGADLERFWCGIGGSLQILKIFCFEKSGLKRQLNYCLMWYIW